VTSALEILDYFNETVPMTFALAMKSHFGLAAIR
jgi:hypothetical protein